MHVNTSGSGPNGAPLLTNNRGCDNEAAQCFEVYNSAGGSCQTFINVPNCPGRPDYPDYRPPWYPDDDNGPMDDGKWGLDDDYRSSPSHPSMPDWSMESRSSKSKKSKKSKKSRSSRYRRRKKKKKKKKKKKGQRKSVR
jgi:hypothetical protein